MENHITFEPFSNIAEYAGMIAGLVICLIILGVSFLKKYKILPMVTGLVALILAGSTVMTWLADNKTQSLRIENNKIVQSGRTIHFRDIKNVFIETRHKPTINPESKNNEERFLVIDVFEQKPIVLPQTLFLIDSMKIAIDGQYRTWKNTQKE
jgi:hypothetical protein